MRLRLPIAAAALLALAPLSFAGGGTKAIWEGFGEGSWVESKSTVKMSMAGKALPDTVVEKRDTLVKVTDEAWTVRIEKKSGRR